jgi:hypothetical protein
MFRSGVSGRGVPLSQVDEPPYEKGDRVWVLSGHGLHLPGVVIGCDTDWNLYRVVYMDDISGQGPRTVQEWRLSPRREEEAANNTRQEQTTCETYQGRS